MSQQVTRWELRKGIEVLGSLTAYGWTYPWRDCEFEPTDAFDEHRALFTREFTLLNSSGVSDDAWEAAYNKIAALGIAFVPVDDDAYALMQHLLDQEGDKPWLSAVMRDG